MESSDSKRWLRTAFLLYPIAMVAGLFLPFLIRNFINRRLKIAPGYYGHLFKVQCSPFSSTIRFTNVFINRFDETSGQELLFFRADSIKIKLHWLSLWNCKIVADVFISAPYLSLVKIYGRAVNSFFQSTFDLRIPV